MCPPGGREHNHLDRLSLSRARAHSVSPVSALIAANSLIPVYHPLCRISITLHVYISDPNPCLTLIKKLELHIVHVVLQPLPDEIALIPDRIMESDNKPGEYLS